MKDLDWLEILEALKKRATSDLGVHHLHQLAPLESSQEAQESFKKIKEFQRLMSEGHRPEMLSLDLFEMWFSRLSKNAVLKLLELKDIRLFCLEALELKEALGVLELPYLKKLSESFFNLEEPLSAIDSLITPEGDIRKDASEELYKCTLEKEKLEKSLQKKLDKIVKEHDMKYLLQDKYVTSREGRWVIPIKSSRQHDFEGIIHDSSQSRQTVFMEPQEVISLNNDLRKLELRIKDEIDKLLKELSSYLYSFKKQWEITKDIMLECDLEFAKAHLACDLKAHPCEFVEKEIYLKKARNPVLVLRAEPVVDNTIEMKEKKRILILSGPNAGGKTVLLKTIGLAAYMSSCGLPICAEASSQMPFFKKIYVAVGDLQNITHHLSTFAAHLEVLHKAIEAKGYDKLLLIDEICGSTDPEEGGALARSFIEEYVKNKIFGVITSHLSSLKVGWRHHSGVVNGSLQYDEKTSKPLYQFVMGVPGESLALQTARRVGVQESLIKKAMGFLSPERKKYETYLDDIKKEKKQTQELKEDLVKEMKSYEEKRKIYEDKVLKLEKEKEEIIEKERKRARHEIDDMISKAKAQEVLTNYKHLQKMKEKIPVNKTPKEKNVSANSLEDFKEKFPPGVPVFIRALNRKGIVQSEPNKKGEVQVLSQSLRFSTHWKDIEKDLEALSSKGSLNFQRRSLIEASNRKNNVVDLRGCSVAEALQALEKKIDEALLNDMDRLKIIHGHGGEVLKRAVRTYLSKSPHIKKWMSGSDSEGDGVTWIEI